MSNELNHSQFVREALLEVNDPEGATTTHILAMARAKLAQAGGRQADLKDHTVLNIRHRLHKQIGKPLTKEKLRKLWGGKDVPKPTVAKRIIDRLGKGEIGAVTTVVDTLLLYKELKRLVAQYGKDRVQQWLDEL